MVEIQTLPELTQETIIAAYQLLKFHNTGHQYAEREITKDCLNTFQFIVAHYTDLSSPSRESTPTNRSASRRGRSTGRDLTPDFPPNWSLEGGRSEIRRAQTSFLASLGNLHSHSSFIKWLEGQSKNHLPSPESNTASMGDQEEDLNQRITNAVARAMEAEHATTARTVADAIRDALGQQHQPPPRNQTQNEPPVTPSIPFKIEEIGYFDPELDARYGEGDIVTVGKESYTRDVHLFVSRLKDAAAIKGADQVKIQLPGALKGIALKWYMNELNDDTRLLMRISEGMTIWCEKLTKRFRENPSIAMDKAFKERFTLQNARDGRAPADYVSNIFRHGQSADLSHASMIRLAWQNLAVELRSTIDLPEPEDTTREALVQKFKSK
jgi:hypothetical protein